MRRITGALVIAAAFSLSLVATAGAGGWWAVSVDDRPDVVQAGKEFKISFSVLHHGMSPEDGLHPAVTFTNQETGDSHVADASPTGQEGQYSVTATLPEAGIWHWETNAFGTHAMAPFNVSGGEVAGSSTSSNSIVEQPLVTLILAIGAISGFASIWSTGLLRGSPRGDAQSRPVH